MYCINYKSMNKRKLIFAVLLMAVFVFNIKAQDSKTVIIDQVVAVVGIVGH